MAVFPSTAASIETSRLVSDAPRLDYAVFLTTAGDLDARLDLLPTQPNVLGHGLRVAVALDEQTPVVLTAGTEVGTKAWAQSVLDERVTAQGRLRVESPGAHVLRVFMVDPGVLVDKIVLEAKSAAARPTGYFGPPETRAGE